MYVRVIFYRPLIQAPTKEGAPAFAREIQLFGPSLARFGVVVTANYAKRGGDIGLTLYAAATKKPVQCNGAD